MAKRLLEHERTKNLIEKKVGNSDNLVAEVASYEKSKKNSVALMLII
ncbi:MAG: hypothetical protein PV340_03630 [Wolbachia sp.]|nr:hypothetical protein [Wolbachia sp.]MDD9336208.1 hypothetical protein [Wolbachia sp.]